jgi:excisionase family DNA binding protein
MARADKPKELFTASEVARFCQVDLKTIHNWSDRGEIRHFRTPGRHLRFRRTDVLDFLRKYGYPIPVILSDGKPRVLVVCTDTTSTGSLKRALSKQFEVIPTEDVYCAMITVGHQPPDVVIVDASLGGACALALINALKGNEATRNVRTVLLSDASESTRKKALDAGASTVVDQGDTTQLRETLEALLGLGR